MRAKDVEIDIEKIGRVKIGTLGKQESCLLIISLIKQNNELQKIISSQEQALNKYEQRLNQYPRYG